MKKQIPEIQIKSASVLLSFLFALGCHLAKHTAVTDPAFM